MVKKQKSVKMPKFKTKAKFTKKLKLWIPLYLISATILVIGIMVPIMSLYRKYETENTITKKTIMLSQKLKENYVKFLNHSLLIASPEGETKVWIKSLEYVTNKHQAKKNIASMKWNNTFIVKKHTVVRLLLLPGQFFLKIQTQPHKSLKTNKQLTKIEDLEIKEIFNWKDEKISIAKNSKLNVNDISVSNQRIPKNYLWTKSYSSSEWKVFEKQHFVFLDDVTKFNEVVVDLWNKNNPTHKLNKFIDKPFTLVKGFPRVDIEFARKKFVDTSIGINDPDQARLNSFKDQIKAAAALVVQWALRFRFVDGTVITLIKSEDKVNSMTGINFKNMMNTNFVVFGKYATPKAWLKKDGGIVQKIQGKPYSWLFSVKNNETKPWIKSFIKEVSGLL